MAEHVRSAAPAAPPGFDARACFEGINWFQRWQIFRGIFTPGSNPIETLCDELGLPHDLSGKRVLDVGAWNGCLSFECERRGAEEVVALDVGEPAERGFLRIRDIVGSTRTSYRVGSVYRLDPAEIGFFDAVLFCGVLYHLRYPLLAIDNLRRVCRGELFVESFVTDAGFVASGCTPRETRDLHRLRDAARRLPLWQFFRRNELGGDASNWFGPNSEAVVQALESAGFETRWLGYRAGLANRATFHATVNPGPPEFLATGAVEDIFYDVAIAHLLGKPKPGLGDGSIAEMLADVLAARAVDSAGAAVKGAEGSPPADGRARSAMLDARLVAAYYRTFLRREAAQFEIDHWLRYLAQGRTHEDTIVGFLASEEYFGSCGRNSARWLVRVHHDLLGQAPATSPRSGGREEGVAARCELVTRIVWTAACRRHLLQAVYASCLL